MLSALEVFTAYLGQGMSQLCIHTALSTTVCLSSNINNTLASHWVISRKQLDSAIILDSII